MFFIFNHLMKKIGGERGIRTPVLVLILKGFSDHLAQMLPKSVEFCHYLACSLHCAEPNFAPFSAIGISTVSENPGLIGPSK